MSTRWFRSARGSASLTQLIAGLVGLPLSALPFVLYASYTPEGRLVRDRVAVTLSPPSLPTLTSAQKAAARAKAPHYEGAVVALVYHGIGSSSSAEGNFAVSAKRFAEHLAYLRAAGMNAVTAKQVAAALAGGGSLPPNAVMISFDDGRNDAMLFADPLLEDAKMAATMFVIADAASRPGVYYASWDRIESYARSGRWDIQSHTASSHYQQKVASGGRLPALTSRAPGESLTEYRTRVREDLARASAEIESHTGARPVAFAYPFGAYGADRANDPAIRTVLREEITRQYAVAFHQDGQDSIPLLTPAQDLLGLRRLSIGNWSGSELLTRLRRIAHGPEAGSGPTTVTGTTIPFVGTFGPPSDSPPNTNPPSGIALPTPQGESGAAVVNVPAFGGGAFLAPNGSPSGTTPPTTTLPRPPGASPPVTSPPVTSPPATSPPATAPPATTPPTTSAPRPTTTVAPTCNVPANGKGPKTCPPGQSG